MNPGTWNSLLNLPTPTGTDLHKKCDLPKGKRQLNRGSNELVHPPFPFLSPVQTPGFLSKISSFPFTPICLNIIEPHFEPPTARGRLLGSADLRPLTIDLLLLTFAHSSFFLRSLNTEHRKLITDLPFTIPYSLFFSVSIRFIRALRVRIPFPLPHSLFFSASAFPSSNLKSEIVNQKSPTIPHSLFTIYHSPFSINHDPLIPKGVQLIKTRWFPCAAKKKCLN